MRLPFNCTPETEQGATLLGVTVSCWDFHELERVNTVFSHLITFLETWAGCCEAFHLHWWRERPQVECCFVPELWKRMVLCLSKLLVKAWLLLELSLLQFQLCDSLPTHNVKVLILPSGMNVLRFATLKKWGMCSPDRSTQEEHEFSNDRNKNQQNCLH